MTQQLMTVHLVDKGSDKARQTYFQLWLTIGLMRRKATVFRNDARCRRSFHVGNQRQRPEPFGDRIPGTRWRNAPKWPMDIARHWQCDTSSTGWMSDYVAEPRRDCWTTPDGCWYGASFRSWERWRDGTPQTTAVAACCCYVTKLIHETAGPSSVGPPTSRAITTAPNRLAADSHDTE